MGSMRRLVLNTIPPKTKLVLAGNYSEFLSYCRETGQNPNDRCAVRYISKLRDIEGLDAAKIEIVMYGTCHTNKLLHEPCFSELERRSKACAPVRPILAPSGLANGAHEKDTLAVSTENL